MRNIKLTIEYDGTNYVGWQRQENGKSVQGQIEKAIKKASGKNVKLIGSGRTDSGVHGRGQVANFKTSCTIPSDNFKLVLNNNLPDDIVILNSEEVDINFHSRYGAKSKKYSYLIYNNKTRSALYRNYAYHVSYDLKYDEMEKAIKLLEGTHDFTSFTVARNQVATAVRTISKISLNKRKDLIYFSIEGDGFLYNMIRIIVGTIIEIGRGRLRAKDILNILDVKDRKFAGHTAPPQGLYLEKVYY